MKISEIHEMMNFWRGILKVLENDWQTTANKLGITMAELHILWILYFEKEATMTEIAEIGLWDVSTVMQVVKRLKKKGFVTSKKRVHDRRISYVSLTVQGEKIRKDSENYEFRFDKYLLEITKSEAGKSFLQELFVRQREINEHFHGKRFVDWVEKTSAPLKETEEVTKKI